MPKISVIMSAYNAERDIQNSITAVLNQTFADFELIVVNDGSTDKTAQIIESLAQTDPRIHPIDRKNGGPGRARNSGLDAASGEYVIIIDSDDFMHPDCLHEFASRFDSKPDMLACGYLLNEPDFPERTFTRGDITCYSHEMFLRLLPQLISKQLAYVPWNKMIRRQFIEDNNIRYTDFRSCEDRIFNLECFEHLHTFTFIEKPVYSYFVRDDGGLNNRFLTNRREALDLFCRKLLGLYKTPDRNALSVFAAAYTKGIYACILSVFHPTCTLDNEHKREYVRTVLNGEYVKFAASRSTGLGMLIPQLALKTKNVFICMTVARLIGFINTSMHGLFLKLKHSR